MLNVELWFLLLLFSFYFSVWNNFLVLVLVSFEQFLDFVLVLVLIFV